MYDPEYHKSYQERNREKLLAYRREWAKKNREKLNAQARQLRANNPLKYRKLAKVRRKSQREHLRRWYAEYRSSGVWQYLQTKLSHLKKGKGKTFNLDLPFLVDLWQQQNGCCAISHYPMKHCFRSLFSASIDRIDSSKGYTKDNVQLVCQGINFAKNVYSNDEMLHFWNFRDSLSNQTSLSSPDLSENSCGPIDGQ